MHNSKIKNLKDFLSSNDFYRISFDQISELSNCSDIIKELIYVVGYNNIEVDVLSPNIVVYKAGMFWGDLDEKLILNNGHLDGKLLPAIQAVFNVLSDIQRQSNIIDLYSHEMKSKIINDILQKNSIDSCFYNQILIRMAS